MKTADIHPVKIAFDIPVGPDSTVKRFVYAYLVAGDRLFLVDTGVAGAEKTIEAALQQIGRDLSDIDVILLTHSHPDHIGSAPLIQKRSGARVWAHGNEQDWIEDTARQERERPVPGFAGLVSGPVGIDRLLADGDVIRVNNASAFEVLHTPGHSPGSISLFSTDAGILFCGDVIPQPGGMPIYEDVAALARSLARFAKLDNLKAVYSSWADPLYDRDAGQAVLAGIRYLKRVHDVVIRAEKHLSAPDPMALCRQCIDELGLPGFAANPLVARSLQAHREAAAREAIDALALFLGENRCA